jgi:7-cyano-7-deazaguanine synthase
LAWLARPDIAIIVDYGQVSAKGEIDASKSICDYIGIDHRVVSARADFVKIGLLAGIRSVEGKNNPEFWPFRNQFIITCALMGIYSESVNQLLIGTVRGDKKFADGTKGFLDAANALIAVQEERIMIEAPAIDITSAELLVRSGLPKSLIGLTFSCHAADVACGECPGCVKNRALLAEFYDKV